MAERQYGFLGVGAMGLPMVRRARAAGLAVMVHDRDAKAVAEAVALGAVSAPTPVALADAVDCVFVSLPTPAISEAVVTGPGGLAEGRAIRHHIDLSTTGPAMATKIAGYLSERGIATLDAPVSGGPLGVNNGTLAIMASGPAETLEIARPFLNSFARKIVHVGPEVGQGQVVKLANNILAAANLVAVGEVLAMAGKAGIDGETLFDVINASSGRSWVSEVAYPKYVLPRTWDQGFRIELMHKDVTLAMQAAESTGTPMWVGATVRQFYQYLMTQGMGPRDVSEIARVVGEWAGLDMTANRPGP